MRLLPPPDREQPFLWTELIVQIFMLKDMGWTGLAWAADGMQRSLQRRADEEGATFDTRRIRWDVGRSDDYPGGIILHADVTCTYWRDLPLGTPVHYVDCPVFGGHDHADCPLCYDVTRFGDATLQYVAPPEHVDALRRGRRDEPSDPDEHHA